MQSAMRVQRLRTNEVLRRKIEREREREIENQVGSVRERK